MSPCGHFLDNLIQKYNIGVFLVTHAGKDFGRGIRGTSFWAGWYAPAP
jgi:hypothetical protein